jgi:outer membrane protein assembly factor BamB
MVDGGNKMKINRTRALWGSGAALVGAIALTCAALPADGPGFNTPGNILIADQSNNRVIEVDPGTHNVVWTFGDGSSIPGPTSVVGTNDAQRVGNLTLVAGTGVPPGLEPSCPSGCADNRVMLVDQQGRIVWQYGQAGVTGSGPNELNTPVQNTFLPNGNVMITDQVNERVIVVNTQKQIVWQYGMTGVSGSGFDQLNNPNSAELLTNGNILMADENNNRVIEVNPRSYEVVWQYPPAPDPALLNGAAFASRLPDGNTLITDSNNNRIIEVTQNGAVVFSYSTLDPNGNPNPLPTRAVRLRSGLTLISDQFNDRVIAVTQQGKIVFTQGMLNAPGNGWNQLNAPYDAKVVGEYIGLTPP